MPVVARLARALSLLALVCVVPRAADAAHRYALGGAWDADASWDDTSCAGGGAPGRPGPGDDVVLCPDRTVVIPCGLTVQVSSISTDASWTLASGGGILADHSTCPAGQVGKLIFDSNDYTKAGARLRSFGPNAVLVLKGRRIADAIRVQSVDDFDAGDDQPAAGCEDGTTRGSVAASTRAGDCFEISHTPLDPAALDASGWAVPKQPIVFFRDGRYRDGFARVLQTAEGSHVRLAFTQPDQTYGTYAAAHATVVHSFDTSNPTRITASIRTGTLPDPIPCIGVCLGGPATGDGTGALVGMCLTFPSSPNRYPILGTTDGGDGDDRLVFEQDTVLSPDDTAFLPRDAWIAPCIRGGEHLEAWEPFVITVAKPGVDRGGIAIDGGACPVLEGVQYLKMGALHTFSGELGAEGNDALLEFYDSYAGCTVNGPVAVDGVYYVPHGTNGPYPLHIDNVTNLTVRRFAEQGFYQNGGGDQAVPHSAKLQDCADVVLDHHSVGWLPNESPWMSPLDAIDESAQGVPEGVGVELSNFNVHDVWSPPGVSDGNAGPNFNDGGVARGVNRVLIHDGMVWNAEFPLVVGFTLPTSEGYVWNVVIGPPHWPRDDYTTIPMVGISGHSADARGTAGAELLVNSVIVGGIAHASAGYLGLQNWRDAYYTAIGESLHMDGFNGLTDHVRRRGMFYRQSGPTMLAEYTGGGAAEALTIPRYHAMDAGTVDDPNVWYRDIVVKRFCYTGSISRAIGVQNAQVPTSADPHNVIVLEDLTIGAYCPELTATPIASWSAALYLGGDVDDFLDVDSSIQSVLAITGDPADAYGTWAVSGTNDGIGGPAIRDVLCSRCRNGGLECSDTDHCLSGGDGWTPDLATMTNRNADPTALGVRASVADQSLALVLASPAWPSVASGHLGAGYAGLALPFPTLDDYGIRFADWSYRATQVDEPDLRDLPAWLRARFGVACSNGVDDDGDGLVDYPDDPGCKSSVSTVENPPCQNGLDDDGDGRIDFDGGASSHVGDGKGFPDPECHGVGWGTSESPPACGLGAELALFALIARRWTTVAGVRRTRDRGDAATR